MVSVTVVTAAAGLGDQVFEVAAGGGGDGGADFAGVFVDIVFRRIDGDGTAGSFGGDGDHCAVAQGDGHWCAGRVGQVRGVNDRSRLQPPNR